MRGSNHGETRVESGRPAGFVGWLSDWFGVTLRQNDGVDAW